MKSKMVNWSIKLGLVGLTTLATTLAIVGCDMQEVSNVEASGNSNIKLYVKTDMTRMGSKTNMYEVVDEETGVHYMVLTRFDGGAAITPLYNADGTLKID